MYRIEFTYCQTGMGGGGRKLRRGEGGEVKSPRYRALKIFRASGGSEQAQQGALAVVNAILKISNLSSALVS